MVVVHTVKSTLLFSFDEGFVSFTGLVHPGSEARRLGKLRRIVIALIVVGFLRTGIKSRGTTRQRRSVERRKSKSRRILRRARTSKLEGGSDVL